MPSRQPPEIHKQRPRRIRRIAVVAATVALIPVALSYVNTMAQPSNSSFGVRSVEWLRDHGAAGLVSRIEATYYSLTAPAKGGPTLHSLPSVGYGSSNPTSPTRRSAPVAYAPPPIAPLIHPALAGEGVWRTARPGAGSDPPLLVTTLRNQREYPRVLAGLAWIDTKRTRLTLNPGRTEPSVEVPRGSMDVPHGERAGLLATFNSGFKLSDSGGGFVLHGRTYAPMRQGEATLVGYGDGRVNVLAWNYGPSASSSVSFARQNLPLIVDHGQANPNINDGPEWGATLGNAILVWRSAIGIDRHGDLLYLAGDNQTVHSLANTLVHAGAVRAMELDINSYWVSFITYRAPGASRPRNLLPDMVRPATRYLTPEDRDFFAVYTR
jgi:Phosphodiester glycosidase